MHFSPMRATNSAHLIVFAFIIQMTLDVHYRSWSSSLSNFVHSSYTSYLLDEKFFSALYLAHPQHNSYLR